MSRSKKARLRGRILVVQERWAPKLDKLRIAINQGIAALERGDYTEVKDEDLDAYLDELATGDVAS